MSLEFITLLFCYGFCFGLQNKVVWFYGKSEFTDKLLQCSYCLGFHCGWVAWILVYLMTPSLELSVAQIISSILYYAFSSSAFCYVLDSIVQWVESNTLGEE